jgi:hypothetical protein
VKKLPSEETAEVARYPQTGPSTGSPVAMVTQPRAADGSHCRGAEMDRSFLCDTSLNTKTISSFASHSRQRSFGARSSTRSFARALDLHEVVGLQVEDASGVEGASHRRMF